MNSLKTFMLIAAMTALFGFVGLIIGGEVGMLIALLVAACMNLFAYWNSDALVLRLYQAQPVDATSAPEFYALVKQLAQNARMPMPKVYIIDTPQPNAFATGRNPNHAAVAATSGLLGMLTYEEISGVMAHELAHIYNRDTLTMTITATLAGAIAMLANFGLFFGGHGENRNPIAMIMLALLAPLAASLVQMAISRSREYEADRLGAKICGNPQWLAAALKKIEQGASYTNNHAAEANPATAHMFIINPLHGRGMDNLFSTHPKTANRVAALMRLRTKTNSDRQTSPKSTHPRAQARKTSAASRAANRSSSRQTSNIRSKRRPWD